MFTTAFFCFSCGCLHYSLLLGRRALFFQALLLLSSIWQCLWDSSHFTSSDTLTFFFSPCLYYRRRMPRVGNVSAILFWFHTCLLPARSLRRLPQRTEVTM
ncbi:hypothetical protein BDV38DRAFT_196603 [Aspergillus pseudotamarii]|uniref:Uncharacterized protein n=1 Tax=Aspergillus pseudotamarii TaxID=132259 RepID=A0A5N6SEC2_ASPPS|nr:uncharacterized protein BDV38DRAFT_196603 [Aspergillus pseudotamarii]KAE8133012.1 hypothetical protein BDV38DRAFT_196603 [Aspergillus pseudotamarii]